MVRQTGAFATAALLGVLAIGVRGQTAVRVDFPEGYRTWTHTKSMVVQDGHFLYKEFGGIHHIYANGKALAALQANATFPDGSVFVLDVLAARADANALLEGARSLRAVMHKDGKRFAKTGGWGYEVFKGEARQGTVSDGGTRCHGCHTSRRSHDCVLHDWRP
jgi:hypothetical protein